MLRRILELRQVTNGVACPVRRTPALSTDAAKGHIVFSKQLQNHMNRRGTGMIAVYH
jgi:hypothetical protein